MTIVYKDEHPNIEVDNIIPDDNPAAVKDFTVTGTNTTDLPMAYYLSLVVTANSFSNDALSYTLTSTNTDSNGETASNILIHQGIKMGARSYSLGEGHFVTGTNKVHTYELKLYFLNKAGINQNKDQGKTFKAQVGIVSEPVNQVIIENIQVGESAFVSVDNNGDIRLHGTGSTWDAGDGG